MRKSHPPPGPPSREIGGAVGDILRFTPEPGEPPILPRRDFHIFFATGFREPKRGETLTFKCPLPLQLRSFSAQR